MVSGDYWLPMLFTRYRRLFWFFITPFFTLIVTLLLSPNWWGTVHGRPFTWPPFDRLSGLFYPPLFWVSSFHLPISVSRYPSLVNMKSSPHSFTQPWWAPYLTLEKALLSPWQCLCPRLPPLLCCVGLIALIFDTTKFLKPKYRRTHLEMLCTCFTTLSFHLRCYPFLSWCLSYLSWNNGLISPISRWTSSLVLSVTVLSGKSMNTPSASLSSRLLSARFSVMRRLWLRLDRNCLCGVKPQWIPLPWLPTLFRAWCLVSDFSLPWAALL